MQLSGVDGRIFLAENFCAARTYRTDLRTFVKEFLLVVTSNGVKKQESVPEKRRRNLRKLSEEGLERRRRREHFNEEHRKAERNRARDKTLIYNGSLVGNVFLLNACLAASHILYNSLGKKGLKTFAIP